MVKGQLLAYADFVTEDGRRVLVEQKTEDLGYEAAVARGSDQAVSSHIPFPEVIDLAISPISEAFVRSADRLMPRPDELSVEFGIRIHYRAGAIVSTDLTGCHFKVTLKWRPGGLHA